ncbi:MAG: hypothetical protein KU29_07895 [Sulfurovum sp. FS06-10]|nr:MAG: hypothetical protein KU29_07895 [Sulfurovum sp. FS06-10]
MNTILQKIFALSAFLVAFTLYGQADTTLSTSKQVDKKIEKIEKEADLPKIEVELEASTDTKNPKLKQGKGCDFTGLEEIKGEIFSDYPMAQTETCENGNCANLEPATMLKDDYKDLPDAKVDPSCSK